MFIYCIKGNELVNYLIIGKAKVKINTLFRLQNIHKIQNNTQIIPVRMFSNNKTSEAKKTNITRYK